ncbi:MAG: major capsid protein [Microvirus sp.]|nr:MAG: major capsid protein [Microvirus sp.]
MNGINLPARQLVSQADRAMIERPDVPRSKFTGSWARKMTFDAGYLVPFMVDEVLPGDHLSYDVTAYVRLATPLFPMFDNQRIDTFFFFCPNRLLWSNWEKFMGEQNRPADSIAYTIPYLDSATGGFPVNTVFDHFNLPMVGQVTAGQVVRVNSLPLRAYRLIYLDWFRDENNIDEGDPMTSDGPDSLLNFITYARAKSHDYFTSALPWPNKFTAPSIPLSGQAPISGIGNASTAYVAGATVTETAPGGTTAYTWGRDTSVAANFQIKGSANSGGRPQIFAELSLASSTFTINVLRQAFLTQQLLERDARGGTRYIEILKSHFGVTSPDARLDRPEYIGGGSTPLVLTPVAQTAPVSGVGVGALGAAGTATGAHRASYAATEHGYIIGMINVKTELSYQQGLHKMWTRQTRYDFYWPSLAGLGEQAVLRQELYVTGDDALDATVFGYQERWQEYRTRTSEVTGMFRSTTASTIDPWHLAQRFSSPPVLGATFLNDSPPMARVLAAGSLAVNQQYLADILINRSAVRCMPMYGSPVRLGRF